MSDLNQFYQGGFNPQEAEDNGDFENLPDGTYFASIIKAEIENYDNDNPGIGKRLKVSYKCEADEDQNPVSGFANDRFCLVGGPKPDSKKWGEIFFQRLCVAIWGKTDGRPSHVPADADELLGKYVKLTLKSGPPNAQGKVFQNVDKVASIESDQAPSTPPAQQAAQTPPPASKPADSKPAMPWKR